MANRKKIGALWKKTAKGDGKPYLSGEVEINGVKTPLIVFQNGYKEKDTQPDFVIYESEERQGRPAPPPAGDVSDDDVPF